MPELSHFTSEFFKALSHPLRIKTLDALRGGEVGVNELSVRLGVEQTTLSQQLAVLRKSNIVVGRKEGQNVYYSVRDTEIFRLLDVARIRLDVAQSRFEDQFQHNVLADKPAEHFLGIGDQRLRPITLGRVTWRRPNASNCAVNPAARFDALRISSTWLRSGSPADNSSKTMPP